MNKATAEQKVILIANCKLENFSTLNHSTHYHFKIFIINL